MSEIKITEKGGEIAQWLIQIPKQMPQFIC